MRTALIAAALGAAVAAAPAPAAVDPFAVAGRGCPMAHCDARMSDLARMPAPRTVGPLRLDRRAASAAQGLGCSSNGTVVACSAGERSRDRSRAYVRTYDAAGRQRWTSGTALNAWAWTSAPMVDADGGVVAADDRALVRFAPGGRLRWSTRTPGGAPISPVQTADRTIVLATSDGPISAYDPGTGRRIGVLDLRATLGGLSGRFDTTNTPGRRGNRIYVSTQFKLDDGRLDPNHHARLYAIDVDRDAPAGRRLRVAWFHEFGARSGASPLVLGDTVVFDGDRSTPSGPFAPRYIALRDTGRRPRVLWESPLGGPSAASAAQDPRGGMWVFAFGGPTLRRLSPRDGSVVQTIDLDRAVGAPGTHTPYSAMTIADGPVMLVTARAGRQSSYVVALDLVRGRALWKVRMPDDPVRNTPMGQFPIACGDDGRPSVFFSMLSGVGRIAATAPPRSPTRPAQRRRARCS
jgi:outer membrane protein assembly factor BamB